MPNSHKKITGNRHFRESTKSRRGIKFTQSKVVQFRAVALVQFNVSLSKQSNSVRS